MLEKLVWVNCNGHDPSHKFTYVGDIRLEKKNTLKGTLFAIGFFDKSLIKFDEKGITKYLKP